MLGFMQEYLAECQRQRTTPYEGFIRHLSTNTIDCDLGGAPINAIRIFGMALRNSSSGKGRRDTQRGKLSGGVNSARGPSSNCGGGDGGGGTLSRPDSAGSPLTGRSATLPRHATTTDNVFKSSTHSPLLPARRGAIRERNSNRRATSADNGGSGGTRLTCLRLYCSGQSSPPRPADGSNQKETKELRRCGAAPLPPASSLFTRKESCAIALPNNRSVLRVLVDGLAGVVEDSSDCLNYFQFSGFPLHQMGGESCQRLLRAVSRCTALHTLSLSGSSLSPELLDTFRVFSLSETNHQQQPPQASGSASSFVPASRLPLSLVPSLMFPSLSEADFSGCGLSDKCVRPLQFLISLSKERASLARWLRSLRGDGQSVCGGEQRVPATAPVTKGLERLDISDNALGDATLLGIARVTRDDSTLRTLSMSRNRVTADGLYQFLASGVLESSALDVVDFSRNPCCYADGDCKTSSSGGRKVHPMVSLQAPPVPLLRCHQCVAGGLGQLLILRHREDDGPASKQARCNPGRLSIQTGESGGGTKDSGDGPRTQGSENSPLLLEQESLQGPLGPPDGTAAIPFPAMSEPNQHYHRQQHHFEQRDARYPQPRSETIRDHSAAVGRDAEAQPPIAPQQQQQQQQLGQQLSYPLPPGSYILPVYQPYPPPNLFPQAPPPLAAPLTSGGHCCLHCCCACQRGDGAGSREHGGSGSSGGRHQARHHPHSRAPSGGPAGGTTAVAAAAGNADVSRSRGLDEPSINMVSALTSPADQSFAALAGSGADRLTANNRRRPHGQVATDAPPAAPSTVESEESGAEELLSVAGHGSGGGRAAGRSRRGGVLFDPMLTEQAGGDPSETTHASLHPPLQHSPSTSIPTALTVLAPDSHAGAQGAEAVALALAASFTEEMNRNLQAHLQRQESLMERLVSEFDNYELELTEKLEKHHQQSTTRLDAVRKELLTRLEKLGAQQQAHHNAAEKERQEAREAVENCDSVEKDDDALEDAEKRMEGKLVDLMQFLMRQIHSRVARSSNADAVATEKEKAVMAQRAKVGDLFTSAASSSLAVDVRSETAKRQEMISAANTQLRALGW